jgi:protoporphyrin/coproporphyrin ferrochelatase
MSDTRSGVLLMTYGSPASLERDDMRTYLARIRGDREPDEALVDEFTRRYRVIGGSPLIQITRLQAAGLEARLGWPAAIGMRFSAPSIEDGLRSLTDRGVELVAAIVMSPQFSPLLMGGYERDINAARTAIGQRAPRVVVADAWHEEPAFIDALARRIREGLAALSRDRAVPVLLTAHSLPRRVADQEPGYLDQLRVTAELIAGAAGLTHGQWRFCWQSAGHEPGAWMTPDFADLMPELAGQGHRAVLVAPVQFLADHLEILYDVDVGGREQAERAGLAFYRINSLNDDPAFLTGLAAVATRTVAVRAQPVDGEALASLPGP